MATNRMTSELQKAIDCLQVNDVFLQSCTASLTEGFDPKYSAEVDDLKLKFMHLVSRSEILTLKNDDEIPLCLFRVYVVVGARWILENNQSPTETEKKESSEDFKASIEATFVSEYRFTDDPGKEALEAFALNNASYHIWPYWREYLMQQSQRMNLPKVALPIVQFSGIISK